MYTKVFGVAVPAVLGSLFYTADLGGEKGAVYDLPPAQVYAALLATPMPSDLTAELAKSRGATIAIVRNPDRQVHWRLTFEGQELLRVTVDIEPVAEGRLARVTTTVAYDGPSAPASGELPAFDGLAEQIVDEQIDATIAARPFDQAAVKVRMTAYAAKHEAELERDSEIFQAAFRDRSPTKHRGYSGGDVSFRPGQPMMDVSRYDR